MRVATQYSAIHLGSASVLTNASGTVTERDSYDAWGRRRNADGTDNSACSIASATTRGYTGHEMLDSVCEINANARIYDPTIGRFMSADSMIPDPFNSQSLNRYSYVNNGPLSATDPTGHQSAPRIHYDGPAGFNDGGWANGWDVVYQAPDPVAAASGGGGGSSGGNVTVVDGTTHETIGTCGSAADCARLISQNYSSISSISSSPGSLSDGSSGTSTSGGTGGDATGAGAIPSASWIETVVVTALAQLHQNVYMGSLALDTNGGYLQNASELTLTFGYLPPDVVQSKILPYHGHGNGLKQGRSEWSSKYSNNDALAALAQAAVANGQEIARGAVPGSNGYVYVWNAPGAGNDAYLGPTDRFVVYTTGMSIDLGLVKVEVRTVTNMFPRATGY